jgi:hypothetical protein
MTFIFQKPEFQTLQAAFRQQFHNKTCSASDMIMYNIIRGRSPDKGFTPATRPSKLNNGYPAWYAFAEAKRTARSQLKHYCAMFGQPLTSDQQAACLAALEV